MTSETLSVSAQNPMLRNEASQVTLSAPMQDNVYVYPLFLVGAEMEVMFEETGFCRIDVQSFFCLQVKA